MSEEQKKSDNRSNPTTDEFRAFVKSGWAPRSAPDSPERAEVAPYAAHAGATRSAPTSRASGWSSPPAASRSAATTPTTCSGRTRRSPTSPGSAATRSRTPCWCSSRSPGRRPRGGALLPPWGGRDTRRVLRRHPVRRVLGRRPADAGGHRGRVRADRAQHRRVRRRRGQGRRRGHRAGGARRRPRRDGAGRRGRGAAASETPRTPQRVQAPVEADDELAHFLSHAATGQGRVGGRADAARRRGDPGRVRGGHRRAARRGRQGPRRAVGRGRLRPARPPPGQRRRLRLDLRRGRPRQHPALDQEHRRRRGRRAAAPRRRRRGRLAVHRRHHPHAAGRRDVHRGPAQDLRRGVRRAGGRRWRRSGRGSSSPTSTTPRSG